MIEVVRGTANCENLRTNRKAIGSGGGRAGLIVVLVASFPLSIVPSVSAKPRGQLATSSTSLNFGSVLESSSASQHGTLNNTGRGSVTIQQASISGAAFSISGLSLPLTLSPGVSAAFTVFFTPNAAGSITGSVTFFSDAVNSPTTIALSGAGVAPSPQISLSPAAFNFGNIGVGSSASQMVTASNAGTATLTISQAAVTGTGFNLSGLTLPVSLPAGTSIAFTVTFAPQAAGTASGSVTLTSDAPTPNSPTGIALSGAGVQPQLSVTPGTISFGNVVDGTTNTQTIQLTNSGTATLTVSQAAVSGSGLTMSGLALPLALSPGQSANFNLAFSPASAGSATGSVSLASNAPTSPATIAISGTGVAATLQLTASSTSLAFGNVNLGSSGTQTVTLSNTGNSSVSISQINVSGAGFSTGGLTPPLDLAAGQTTTFSVVFTPTSSGSVTGNANVISNACNSPTVIALSGSGVQTIAHSTTLTWDPSVSVVVGYNVYRGTVSGGPYSVLNSSPISTTTDTAVQSGQTYFYVLTAVDSNNVESVYSNEISATIPVP